MEACPHPEELVKLDLLYGAWPDNAIQWCSRCGAYRHRYVTPEGDPNQREAGQITVTDWFLPTG